MKRRIFIPVILLIAIISVVTWYFYGRSAPVVDGLMQASGTVEAVQVVMAPEAGGRVIEVFVEEGDRVIPGDLLFCMDDTLLQGQRQRAVAAVESAQAAVDVSLTGVDLALDAVGTAQSVLDSSIAAQETAGVQLNVTLAAAQLLEEPVRLREWQIVQPASFDQPSWYFQKAEEITAAREVSDAALSDLLTAQADLETLLTSDDGAEFVEVEQTLVQARSSFLVAEAILSRANAQSDSNIKEAAQDQYDSAQEELDAAQSQYDRIFTGDLADEILQTRARVAVEQERFNTAQDQLTRLQTGSDSLQVQAAQAVQNQADAAVTVAEANLSQAQDGVLQAEARLTQAEKAQAQVQAELDLIDIQIEKLTVKSFVAGVITIRNVEPGEILGAGAAGILIAEIDRLTITVYLPEDRYGQIGLGTEADIQIDSFPGRTFEATVIRIADQAEFTPRNAVTEEGRKTTVFAVELKVENPEGELKPGMPADVTFNP